MVRNTPPMRSSLFTVCLLSSLMAVAPASASGTPRPVRPRPNAVSAEDILAKTRAVYAALNSYADTGKILVEYGSATDPAKSVHTFHTYFRKPRSFYFDYQKLPTSGRLVLWTEPQSVHGWWQDTGNEDEYPMSNGTTPFIMSTYPTQGTSVLISALLFPKSNLGGTMRELGEMTDAGMEAVSGAKCYKLQGLAKSVYQTGHEVAKRRVTLWIDAETMLVRQVREEDLGGAAVNVSRQTVTLTPHANPTLDDDHFKFTAPTPQR